MGVCVVPQTQLLNSAVYKDDLDPAQYEQATTLQDDLNYIRSVLKAVHGGDTWADAANIETSVSSLSTDFAVQHYESSTDPSKAGKHKDVTADSVSSPQADFDNLDADAATITTGTIATLNATVFTATSATITSLTATSVQAENIDVDGEIEADEVVVRTRLYIPIRYGS